MQGTSADPAAPVMQLLLASRERNTLGLGFVISVAVHAALVLSVALAYREQPERGRLVDELVTFLLPPDRDIGVTDAPDLPWAGLGGPPPDMTTEVGGSDPGFGPLTEELGDTAGAVPLVFGMPALGDSIFTEFQVDSTVERYPWTAAPVYPQELLDRDIEGSAFVRFVVDTTGFVDTTSVLVIEATHPAFGRAVQEAMPHMRFRPAVQAGHKVRQLVQQSFAFRITRTRIPPRDSGG
jgi:TonB family protein